MAALATSGARTGLGFFIRLLIAIVAGVGIGLSSVYYVLVHGSGQQDVVINGPWRSNLAAGGVDADMYTRATVAVYGLLALNKSETIYYTAREDSAGEAFDPACSYRIEGRDPDARWWSFTAYGRDSYLIPNPQKRYSIGKTNVVRGTDGSFVIRLSRTPEAGNWIATAADGFDVSLRLYNPGPGVIESPSTVALPRIVKETCE